MRMKRREKQLHTVSMPCWLATDDDDDDDDDFGSQSPDIVLFKCHSIKTSF